MFHLAQDFGFGTEFETEADLKAALRAYRLTVDPTTFGKAWAAAGEGVRASQDAAAHERFATPSTGVVVSERPR